MASEEIKLVGSFKDDITPQLKKLNREITNIGRSFERFNKKLAPVTKSFAKMAMSAKTFSDAMATQRQSLDNSSRAMKEYSRQAGKMTGAMRKVQAERMKAQRQMGMSRAQMRKGMSADPVAGAAPKGSSKGAAQASGKQMGLSFRQAVGASALGNMIGHSAMSVMSKGAKILGGVLGKPMKYMGNMLKDRVKDEMDDIKSAGGLFALDMDLTQKSGNERLFNSFNDALQQQEKLNIAAAQSAATLPGVTQDYVNVQRQMTDSIQMVMEDAKGSEFLDLAASVGTDVSMGGTQARKEAMGGVLQNLTESMVLQSQGQQGGLPMHIAVQQMMNAEQGQFKAQTFTNKYRAAFQKNPLLKNFLMRGEEEINKHAAGSVGRLKAIMDIFDRAMPVEVINAMRGSLSGMQEGLRSAFFDQQSGLFGLSRPIQMIGKNGPIVKQAFDDFGNELYELSETFTFGGKEFKKGDRLTRAAIESMGRNVDSIATLATDQTYLFEVIRDTLSGIGVPLLQLAGLIPEVFDPFAQATEAFLSIRNFAQNFKKNYLGQAKFFEKVAEDMRKRGEAMGGDEGRNLQGMGSQLKKQALLRGSLGAINNYLASVGMITEEQRMKTVKRLKKFDKEGINQSFGDLLKPMIVGFVNSPFFSEELPTKLGEMIGNLLKSLADMILGIGGVISGGEGLLTKILDNFLSGFYTAFGGEENFSATIAQVSEVLSNVAGEVIEAAFKIAIPAIGNAIKGAAQAVWDKGGPLGKFLVIAIPAALTKLVLSMTGLMTAANAAAGALMWVAKSQGVQSFAKGAMKQNAAALAAGPGAKGGAKAAAKASNAFGGMMAKIGKSKVGQKVLGGLSSFMVDASVMTSKMGGGGGSKILKSVGGLTKRIPLLNVAFAALDATTRKLSGQSTIKAVSGAGGGLIGSIIGGALGSFLGPLGTLIGSMLGGWLGGIIGDWFGDLDWSGMAAGLGNAWNNMMGFLGDLWSGLASAGTGLMSWVGGLWNNFMEFLGNEAEKFLGNPAFYIGEKLGMLWKFWQEDLPRMLAEAIIAGIMWLGAKIGELSAYLQQAWAGIVQWLQSLPETLAGVWDQITTAIGSAIDGLKMKFSEFVTGLQGLPEQIGPALQGVGDAIINWAKSLPGKVMGGIGDFVKGFTQGSGGGAKWRGHFPGARTAAKGSGNKGFTMTELAKAAGTAAKATTDLTQTWVAVNDGAQSGLATAAAGLAGAINQAAAKLTTVASTIGDDKASVAYNGGSGMMSLASAIATENRMKPPGSDLVIANSSETIIPAYAGNIGDSFKGLDFDLMESAAGFNRMESYTEQLSELADKTAASFGGFGGGLGGGSATLNAMEALGNSMGLITTSGFRPGDPGYHGANRARDLSNGGGETPEMNKVASIMASKYGSSLAELIYTPMGFSIKNGQKTGLISPDNHYHHIHVAVAEGLKKAAVFSSQQAAEAYEKRMMPAGAEPMKVNLGSMTANSSEFGAGGITVNEINVHGVDNPQEIANVVAEEILSAVQRATYSELFTS